MIQFLARTFNANTRVVNVIADTNIQLVSVTRCRVKMDEKRTNEEERHDKVAKISISCKVFSFQLEKNICM